MSRFWRVAVTVLAGAALMVHGVACKVVGIPGADPTDTQPFGQPDSGQQDPSSTNGPDSCSAVSPATRGAVTRLIVRFKDGTTLPQANECHSDAGAAHVVTALASEPLFVIVEVPSAQVDAALAKYEQDPIVEFAEADAEVRAFANPNDAEYSRLWGLRNVGQPVNGTGGLAGVDIRAESAWDTVNGGDVRIAVIDTGIDYLHPDLAANIWVNPGEIPGNGVDDDGNGFIDDVHGYDFFNNDGDPMDDNDHGTHVAGTIGAVGNNGIGVVGVNWRCKLVAVKFIGADGGGRTSDAIRAINYCIENQIMISNNSWGSFISQRSLREAIGFAGSRGHLFIAAAGNSGLDSDQYPEYPAAYPLNNIISVAAINNQDQLASFTNYGASTVDLAAPGVDIFSCSRAGGYKYLSGTSMAAPHVTGVAALIMADDARLGYQDVRQQIFSTVRSTPALAGKTVFGGVLDAGRAVGTIPQSPAAATNLAAIDVGTTNLTISWTDNSTNEDGFSLEWSTDGGLYSLFGQALRNQQSLVVNGLLPAHQYWFRLRAFNSAGASAYSNAVVVTTQPAAAPPIGACCIQGVCQLVSMSVCLATEGQFLGENTTCATSPCMQTLTGACCIQGNCQLVSALACSGSGGQYRGDGTTCSSNPCVTAEPTGACCVQGTCQLVSALACAGLNGQYFGVGSACAANSCTPIVHSGACCASDGACWLLSESDCAGIGGQYQGDGTNCTSSPCAPPVFLGACCTPGGCVMETAINCSGMGGTYNGDYTTCATNPCPPPCPPSTPSPVALTAFATSIEAGSHWTNAASVQGAPGCSVCACDSTNGPYASNCTITSAQFLTGTQFDNFALPQCAQVTRVVLQVNCRYDQDADGANRKFRARLTTPAFGDSWDRDSAVFDTTVGNCTWHDVDFTDLLPSGGWTEARINDLQAGVRRLSRSGESSNSCFRVIALRLRVEYVIP